MELNLSQNTGFARDAQLISSTFVRSVPFLPVVYFLTNLTLRVQAKERQRELLFKLIEQKARMHLHCYDKKPFLTQLSQ